MASIITKASYISTLYLSHNVSSDAWSFFCPNTGDDVINAHRLNCANGLGPPLCRYHNYIYESKAFMEQPQEVGLIRPISPKIDRGPSAPLSQSQPITFTATSSASTERTSQSSRAEGASTQGTRGRVSLLGSARTRALGSSDGSSAIVERYKQEQIANGKSLEKWRSSMSGGTPPPSEPLLSSHALTSSEQPPASSPPPTRVPLISVQSERSVLKPLLALQISPSTRANSTAGELEEPKLSPDNRPRSVGGLGPVKGHRFSVRNRSQLEAVNSKAEEELELRIQQELFDELMANLLDEDGIRLIELEGWTSPFPRKRSKSTL